MKASSGTLSRIRPRLVPVYEFILCALAHFALALGTAFIGFGLDLDQLSSRSWVSRAGVAVNGVLMYPHEVALRAIPNALIIRSLWVIPFALIVHSLIWGALIYICLRPGLRPQRS